MFEYYFENQSEKQNQDCSHHKSKFEGTHIALKFWMLVIEEGAVTKPTKFISAFTACHMIASTILEYHYPTSGTGHNFFVQLLKWYHLRTFQCWAADIYSLQLILILYTLNHPIHYTLSTVEVLAFTVKELVFDIVIISIAYPAVSILNNSFV
eukprot:403355353